MIKNITDEFENYKQEIIFQYATEEILKSLDDGKEVIVDEKGVVKTRTTILANGKPKRIITKLLNTVKIVEEEKELTEHEHYYLLIQEITAYLADEFDKPYLRAYFDIIKTPFDVGLIYTENEESVPFYISVNLMEKQILLDDDIKQEYKTYKELREFLAYRLTYDNLYGLYCESIETETMIKE